MPNIQISEADAPPEGEQTPSPTGTGAVGRVPLWAHLWEDWCDLDAVNGINKSHVV